MSFDHWDQRKEYVVLDTRRFIAGNLVNHISHWKEVSQVIGFTHSEEILGWITNGVDLEAYFVPYKGVYRGNFYDSVVPVPAEFPNSKSVDLFRDFVKNTVITRIRNGSVLPWGKVGYCDPLKVVMGLFRMLLRFLECHFMSFDNLPSLMHVFL